VKETTELLPLPNLQKPSQMAAAKAELKTWNVFLGGNKTNNQTWLMNDAQLNHILYKSCGALTKILQRM
jgi:hypothetical protein